MSDFFAQLGANIRFPDAKINGSGPLPTSLSGPAGVNGDPDGRINFNSQLLEGITPYQKEPGQGRMGSDRNYQQIPHRIQKIVPKLFLPYADETNTQSCIALSHAVDQGDVAFILQTSRVQNIIYDSSAMRDASIANLQIPGHTAFVNISTVNYLLAGLQRLTAQSAQSAPWATLARDLGYRFKLGHRRVDVLQLVSTGMVPFGICAGSEKQGGLHETGLAPVQAAANHVTTLTVDGQNRDLVNLWRNVDVSAGDELIFKLQWLPTQHYTLNHYYKGVVRQSFVRPRSCWQLVPAVFEMKTPLEPASPEHWEYDYRIHGYWRIAQCFQHRASCENNPLIIADDTNFLRGQLLQVTFAPVWTQFQALNAPDSASGPRGAPLAAAGVASERPPARDSTATKRAYDDAFGAFEERKACVLLGAPPPAAVCETVKWSLRPGSGVAALAALHTAPAPPAARVATSAAPLAAVRLPLSAHPAAAKALVAPPSATVFVAAASVAGQQAPNEPGAVRASAPFAVLGAAMALLPLAAGPGGGLPAVSVDKPVKRVVKTGSKKAAASPPATSSGPP
jgi:hypothetical protein